MAGTVEEQALGLTAAGSEVAERILALSDQRKQTIGWTKM